MFVFAFDRDWTVDVIPLVSKNVCWALGHLCTRDATSTLEDRAHDGENADVRTRASWELA